MGVNFNAIVTSNTKTFDNGPGNLLAMVRNSLSILRFKRINRRQVDGTGIALIKGSRGAVIGGLLGAGGGSAYVYAKGRENEDRYGYYRDGQYYRYNSGDGYYADRDYRSGDRDRYDNRRYDRDDYRR